MSEYLYGREGDSEIVRDRATGVVVLAGDSGIGKSEFLSSLSEGWSGAALVSTPIVLNGIRGSLQTAVAQAVGDCLHRYSQRYPDLARELWGKVQDVFGRVVSSTGRQVGKLFVASAFHYLESKIGSEAAQGIRAVVAETLRPASDGYIARLENLIVPDAAAELVGLITEISEYTDHRLIIRLDSGERLADDDRALLAELASELNNSVVLLVCVNSSSSGGITLTHLVEERGAMCHTLSALSTPDIDEWLAAEDVPRAFWLTIAHVSSGYPLFVSDAIRIMKSGAPLTAIESPRGFDALLRAAWRGLDQETQLTVTKIAGFAEPPSNDFLSTYLRLDQLQTSILQRRLLDRGVFVRRPDGREWFHERRRTYIWDVLLTANDRAIVSGEVLYSIENWLTNSDHIDSWIVGAMPAIIREIRRSELPPYLDSVLSLSRDELSFLWALIEVVEPTGESGRFVDTSDVVRYAATRSGITGNSIGAIEHLAELELVVTAADERRSIVTRVGSEPIAYAALIGEIEREFQVRPIPRFASSAFEAFMRPYLLPFKEASISLGEGSLANHKFALSELNRNSYSSGGFGLGIDFIADGHPVTVTASFETPSDRDDALFRISQRYESTPAQHAELGELVLLPPLRTKYGRYESLLDRFGVDKAKTHISSADDLYTHLKRRLAAVQVLRRYMSDSEVSAYRANDGQRYLFDIAADARSWAELLVVGGAQDVLEPTRLEMVGAAMDPLLELRLRADGLLETREQVTYRSVRHSSTGEVSQPLREVVERITKLGGEFNRGLQRVSIHLDESALANAISAEREMLALLGRELVASGILSSDAAVSEGDSLYLVICPVSGSVWSGGAGQREWWVNYYEISDGAAQVIVRVLPDESAPPAWMADAEELRRFGVPTPELIGKSGGGIASSVLSGLLGYVSGDVWIEI